jgi:hypothetical protein
MILFNHEPSTSIEYDLISSPDELLTHALRYVAEGGRDFTRALERAQSIMNSHWSTERYKFNLGQRPILFTLYADVP